MSRQDFCKRFWVCFIKIRRCSCIFISADVMIIIKVGSDRNIDGYFICIFNDERRVAVVMVPPFKLNFARPLNFTFPSTLSWSIVVPAIVNSFDDALVVVDLVAPVSEADVAHANSIVGSEDARVAESRRDACATGEFTAGYVHTGLLYLAAFSPIPSAPVSFSA